MKLEESGAPARGLYRYLRLVNEAVGLRGDAFYIQLQDPAGAYLALDRRLPGLPWRDTALTWDERQGWAVTVETSSGDDLIVITFLGPDVLPAPRVVAEFARQVLDGGSPGQSEAPNLREHYRDEDLAQRLAAYATPLLTGDAG